jgi:hypothetical protein
VWTHFPKFWIDAENCKSLLDAMENYRREFDEKNNVYRNKPLHNWASNYCFTADTLILTRNGMRPIIEITQNDFVLTLEGWKPCSQSIITRKDAQLVAVQFTDGTIVRCTPDHMFLTENGWISAELLTKNTRIQSSLMKSHNTSMDLYIEYGPALNTSLREEDCFIDMFGVAHLAKYHQTTTFITKIKTLKTIIYTILNACIRTSISIYQKVVTEYLVNSAETRLRYGMHLPREYCGIRDKQSDVGLGKNGKERKENVYIASNYLTASLDQMGINRSFAQIIAKPLIIESVKKLKSNEDVYCINVPIVGHFSLSNGAIVKNCDALRYLCQSLHKTKKGLTTEEFERKRAEAMYGPGRFKQKIFNHDPRFDR